MEAGAVQREIRKNKGELVALFYNNPLAEETMYADETDELVSQVWKWESGWRIEDNESLVVLKSYGTGGPDGQRVFFPRFPITYVIDTSTMVVVSGEKSKEYDIPEGGGLEDQKDFDFLGEVKKLNK